MLELSATSKSITLFQLSDSMPDSSLPTCISLEQCLFANVCLRCRGRNIIQHYACCFMLLVFRYVKELLSSPSLAYFVALLMHTAERNVIQLTWGNWGLDVKNLFLRQR